jgi:membrane protease YdiL (CAAX protease family)
MHRFIPIYAQWYGAKVTEMAVQHHARTTGQSKYGLNRTFKVILDLIVVKFLQKYIAKPIYVIGGFGIFSIGIGMATFILATYFKFFHGTSYIQTPLPLLSVFFTMLGFLSILLGIVCEVVVRTYYESQNKKPYHIKNTQNI